MSAKLLFIDTETTGVNTQKCGVFQISGIVEYNEIYEEFDFRCSLFDGDVVEETAFATNKMSVEKIMEFEDPTIVFKKFTEVLGKHVNRYDKQDKFITLGYWSDFDNQILRRWFEKNGDKFFGSWFYVPWVDVAQLATYVFKEDRDIFPNFKLATVLNAMYLSEENCDTMYHDAMYDVRKTREMYWKLDSILKEK